MIEYIALTNFLSFKEAVSFIKGLFFDVKIILFFNVKKALFTKSLLSTLKAPLLLFQQVAQMQLRRLQPIQQELFC
jgi:hypothetical protein